MAQKMLIDATHPEETRVVVADGNKVEEFDFESINKRQIAGNIYLAKVTRVEPSLQAAFVDYGGNRHGFLAFAEVHPDYYQIPVADRERLLAEEAAASRADEAEEEKRPIKKRRRSGSSRTRPPRPEDAAAEAQADGAAAPDAVEAAPEADGEAPAADAPAPDDPATDAPRPPGSIAESTGTEGDSVSEEADAEDDGGEIEEVESLGADDLEDDYVERRMPMRRYKIQEVIKVRQILLVQVVKEERGNKGAALTTYLSLPGRYCVLMPNTARGGGISRKITSVADRKKLKDIASELEVPKGAGLIIRTAGSERTKNEIRRDYEYLMRQWDQVRELTLRSVAPTLIYEEGSLIKRSIRDLYSNSIDEILVEGEAGYREARDYMKMLMPDQVGQVKAYSEQIPLFSRYQVESYLASMFNPVVQLKSGGYIVIGITEALVAIDVNSGRATREHSIEDTALKTNLEASDEIARQLRLRDLAGLIVIDFIDMEERRNNAAVEKRLKDKLKSDRARLQLGKISAFGLLEMSRQRLRPGMLEATTAPCPHCHGTGLIRSGESMALTILREIEEEGVRQRSKEVLVAAPVSVANYLINQKRDAVLRIETRYGLSVRIEADAALISPEYRVERFKVASRVIGLGGITAPVTVDSLMEDEDHTAEAVAVAEPAEAAPAPAAPRPQADDPSQPRKKRRRRRRRGGERDAPRPGDPGGSMEIIDDGSEENGGEEGEEDDLADAQTQAAPAPEPAAPVATAEVPPVTVEATAPPTEPPAPRKPRSRSRKKPEPTDALQIAGEDGPPPSIVADGPFGTTIGEVPPVADVIESADPPKRPRKPRVRKPREADAETAPAATAPEAAAPAPAEPEASPAPEAAAEVPAPALPEVAEVATPPAAAEPAEAPVADAPDAGPPKPKRKGWWSLG